MDPGLGKTSCTLAAISILREKGLIDRALIIAPMRPLYTVWPAEIEKWKNFRHLKYHILHGKGRNAQIRDDTDIILTNPENMLWLFDDDYRPQWVDGSVWPDLHTRSGQCSR